MEDPTTTGKDMTGRVAQRRQYIITFSRTYMVVEWGGRMGMTSFRMRGGERIGSDWPD